VAATSNIGSWVLSVDRTARALDGAYDRAVRDAAQLAKVELTGAIMSMTGDGRLSGVGRRGARVGVRYDIDKGVSRPDRAFVKAYGPLQFVEADTKPHRIPRQRGPRARRRLLVINGSVRSSADHPGTSGKGKYRATQKRLDPKVRRIIQLAHARAVTRR
jgi:hypothetical protein